MSQTFLTSLIGRRRGKFAQWLAQQHTTPRIAWYPSAGTDFRALMYLHPSYQAYHAPTQAEPACPDLFLFTDYFPWTDSHFLDSPLIYSDLNTTMTIECMEELPSLGLTRHPELVMITEPNVATNKLLYLQVKVESRLLGSWTSHVLYAFAENETFYAHKMAPQNAQISHIVHVRYGGGLGGGGKASGMWILHVLKKLQCEVLVSDGHYSWQTGDLFALQQFKEISYQQEGFLRSIRKVDSYSWSGHGDVHWNLVEY